MTINNETYFTQADLIAAGVPEGTVKSGVGSCSDRWQTVLVGNKRVVRYQTLAPKVKKIVSDYFWQGMEEAEYQESLKVATLEIEPAVMPVLGLEEAFKRAVNQDWVRYEFKFGQMVKTEDEVQRKRQITALCRSAAVLELLGKLYAEKGLGFSKYEPIHELLPCVLAWKKNFEKRNAQGKKLFQSLYLPTHPIRLKEKVVQRFVELKPIEAVIELPRAGERATKESGISTELYGLLVSLRASPCNYTNENIIRYAQTWAKEQGLTVYSRSSLGNVLRDELVQNMTTSRFSKAARHGQKFRSSVKIARAMNAGDCWMVDGTRLNIAPHLTPEGKIKYLYWVFVMDVYSGKIIGNWFGYAENHEAYWFAIGMAVRLNGYLPYEIRHDRFPGHNYPVTLDLFAKLNQHGCRTTQTSEATGKVYAERLIGTIQSVFMNGSSTYIGEGIKSTRSTARPADSHTKALNRMAKDRTLEEVVLEASEIIDRYNATPLNQYSKVFRNTNLSPNDLQMHEAPNSRVVELWEVGTLFWMSKELAIRNFKVSHEHRGEKYSYLLPREVELNYSKVVIRFDPDKPETVHLFDPATDHPLGEGMLESAVQLFGPEPEYQKLAERKMYDNERKRVLKEKLNDAQAAVYVEDTLTLSLGAHLSKDAVESAESRYLQKSMEEMKATHKSRTKKGFTPEQEPVKKQQRTEDAMADVLSIL
jgi:hypothetical protein